MVNIDFVSSLHMYINFLFFTPIVHRGTETATATAFGLYVDRVDGIALDGVSFRLADGGADVRSPVVMTETVRKNGTGL